MNLSRKPESSPAPQGAARGGWTRSLLATAMAIVLAGSTAQLLFPAYLVDAQVADAPEAPQAPVAPRATPAPAPASPATVPQAPVPDEVPAPPAPPSPFESDYGSYASPWRRPVVRIAQDYHLRQGDRIREAVVIMGSATIAGHVERDVVVVLGTLTLAPTAVVDGSVVVSAGTAVVEPGARVQRDFVVTAGGVQAPPDFTPGNEYVVIGFPALGHQLQAFVPWFTQGLLWGRLIVPGLAWMWVVVAVVVAVYLVLNLLFARPVARCRDVIVQRPFSAFLAGLLVLVLVGPAFGILAVSIVGIPVIPFIACGLFVALLIGKIGLTRWIGSTIIGESEPPTQGESVRSFAIGTAILLLAYMVPVLGVLVWSIGSVFGLGAATLAFSSALRRESPRKARPVPPVPAAPVAPVSAPATMASQAVAAPPLATVPVESVQSEFVPPAYVSAQATAGSASTAAAAGAPLLVGMPKAPFLDRLAAFALDVLLVSLVYNLLDMDSARAFFTLLLGYHVGFWALKATTVGGIICNLRVVRTDGQPLTFSDALIRGFSSIFSIAALGIGCLWILYDADNQAWHDRFAGTWVVKVPKGWAA